MCESKVLLSSSYVVNLMIFQLFFALAHSKIMRFTTQELLRNTLDSHMAHLSQDGGTSNHSLIDWNSEILKARYTLSFVHPQFVQHLPLGSLNGFSESKVGNANAEGKVTIVGREGSYTKGSLKSPDSSDSSCRLVKGSVKKLTQIFSTYLLNDL